MKAIPSMLLTQISTELHVTFLYQYLFEYVKRCNVCCCIYCLFSYAMGLFCALLFCDFGANVTNN